MSYEKVRSFSIDLKKREINLSSASNNCTPITYSPSKWEYADEDEFKEGLISVLKVFAGGSWQFQRSVDNVWRHAVEQALSMSLNSSGFAYYDLCTGVGIHLEEPKSISCEPYDDNRRLSISYSQKVGDNTVFVDSSKFVEWKDAVDDYFTTLILSKPQFQYSGDSIVLEYRDTENERFEMVKKMEMGLVALNNKNAAVEEYLSLMEDFDSREFSLDLLKKANTTSRGVRYRMEDVYFNPQYNVGRNKTIASFINGEYSSSIESAVKISSITKINYCRLTEMNRSNNGRYQIHTFALVKLSKDKGFVIVDPTELRRVVSGIN